MPVFMFESAKSVPQQSVASPTLASELPLTGAGTNGQSIPFPTSGVFLPGANPLEWNTLTIEIEGAQQAARGAGPTTHATPNGTWTIPAGAAPTITFVPSGTFVGAIAARLRIADSAGRVSSWKPIQVSKAAEPPPAAPVTQDIQGEAPMATPVNVPIAQGIASGSPVWSTLEMRDPEGQSLFPGAYRAVHFDVTAMQYLSRHVPAVGTWWIGAVEGNQAPVVSFFPYAGWVGTTDCEWRVKNAAGQWSNWSTIRVRLFAYAPSPATFTYTLNESARIAGFGPRMDAVVRYFNHLLRGTGRTINCAVSLLTRAEWDAQYGVNDPAYARAGPDAWAMTPGGKNLPASSVMYFNDWFFAEAGDSALAGDLGMFDQLVFHEFCHTVGLVLNNQSVPNWLPHPSDSSRQYFNHPAVVGAYNSMTGESRVNLPTQSSHWTPFEDAGSTPLWKWADGIIVNGGSFNVYHTAVSPISAKFLEVMGWPVDHSIIPPYVRQADYFDAAAPGADVLTKDNAHYGPAHAPPQTIGTNWAVCASCVADFPLDGPTVNPALTQPGVPWVVQLPFGGSITVDLNTVWIAGAAPIDWSWFRAVLISSGAIPAGTGLVRSSNNEIEFDFRNVPTAHTFTARHLAGNGTVSVAMVVQDTAGLTSDRARMYVDVV